MNKFYVYTLKNPITNTVFYVGKGCGNRAFSHEKNCIKNPEKYSKSKKDLVIQSIVSAGFSVKVSLVRENLSEVESLMIESELIHSIGISNLTNIMSKGGASCSELCSKVSAAKSLGIAMLTLPEVWRSDSLGDRSGYTLLDIYNEIEDVIRQIFTYDNSVIVSGFSSAIEAHKGVKCSKIPEFRRLT